MNKTKNSKAPATHTQDLLPEKENTKTKKKHPGFYGADNYRNEQK